MLGEITVATAGRIGLRNLVNVIHTYPTQTEVIKQIADDYNRPRLTPSLKQWLTRWLAWIR